MRAHLANRGSILSVSVADREFLARAHDACTVVEDGKAGAETLEPFAGLSVRVGGWNAPFISLSRAQREDYLARDLATPTTG